MSLKMMARVWELPLPPTQKFVLMAIADEANDEGYCFPSLGRLAFKCSINERSVRRMIGVSTAEGYVAVKQRFNKRGGRTSNGYQLTLDTPRTNCPGGPGATARGARTPVSGGSGHVCPGPPDMDVRVTTTNPSLDPTPPPLPHRDGDDRTVDRLVSDMPGGCGELCFPEGLSSAQRRTVGGHLYDLKFDDAQAILDELAGRMTRESVHNPIRYCVALIEKLKRGEFRLEVGLPIAERRAADRLREQVLRGQWTRPGAATNESSRMIPAKARAAIDRLRGRTDSEVGRLISGSVEVDTPNANEQSI
jgi:hypothetical protein